MFINVNFLDHLTARKLLQFIGQPRVRFVLWDGSSVSPGIDEPIATMYFRDRASLYLTLLRPELHWGDFYSEGRVEVDGDLANDAVKWSKPAHVRDGVVRVGVHLR